VVLLLDFLSTYDKLRVAKTFLFLLVIFGIGFFSRLQGFWLLLWDLRRKLYLLNE